MALIRGSAVDRVTWLTNATLDPFDAECVRAAGLPYGCKNDAQHPLTDAEIELLGEGWEVLPDFPSCEMACSHTWLFEGRKWYAACVVAHFRNDATRAMWGTPVTYETKLPDRATQTTRIREILARSRGCSKVRQLLELDEEPTKDRHNLYLGVPIDWVLPRVRPSYDGLWSWFASLLCV